MRRPDIEPVPELFDIHVMAFADESEATADALARIFAIERVEARRLIADAPVVVKRAATPAVADLLLDVLGPLGAQVVLLPSQGSPTAKVPTSGPVAAAATTASWGEPEADERDFFALDPTPSDPAPAMHAHEPEGGAWGGLDLGSSAPQPASALGAHVDVLAEQARPSLTPRSAPYASFAPPSSPRYVAPQDDVEAEVEAEESFGELDESQGDGWDGTDERALEPEHEADPEAADAAGGDSLELAVPLPTRRMTPGQLPPRPPRAGHAGGGADSQGARRAGSRPDAAAPDLGLGLVPPLPALGSLPPPTPAASATRVASLGNVKVTQAAGGRAVAARSPAAPLSSERSRPGGRGPSPAGVQGRAASTGKADGLRAPVAPVLPQATWLSRAEVPSAPDLPHFGAPAGDAAPTLQAAAAGPTTPEDPARPRPAARAGERVSGRPARKSRLVAVLELVAGLAVFAAGLQLDNTVLHGNADTLWLVLHAFALYGVGSGLYGFRP